VRTPTLTQQLPPGPPNDLRPLVHVSGKVSQFAFRASRRFQLSLVTPIDNHGRGASAPLLFLVLRHRGEISFERFVGGKSVSDFVIGSRGFKNWSAVGF